MYFNVLARILVYLGWLKLIELCAQNLALNNPVEAIAMATFNFALFAIVGFALCDLAASSESCSVATGACDSLDQADDVHVSLLQAGIEHKASVGVHEAVSTNGVNESTPEKENWIGCCHGENCPNASTVDDPCPSECQASYGTSGLCLGRDNDNNTCPETFDLTNGEFCPQGCLVTSINLTSRPCSALQANPPRKPQVQYGLCGYAAE